MSFIDGGADGTWRPIAPDALMGQRVRVKETYFSTSAGKVGTITSPPWVWPEYKPEHWQIVIDGERGGSFYPREAFTLLSDENRVIPPLPRLPRSAHAH